ncbi:putative transporter (transmembrane protein) [Kribbella amoyensis]|uniref:Putative transporter (Transmembrane protein) n=1 Tax=Kribbella amoyensis TaxID=996641 RepID=A0A561BSB9_9ACTN|nr:mechanosensitive ion channel family protein [Kribbella amoyensis]TWD81787.1 putative transporter (transmembrane protein) [Kribbella amoyensis]
MSVLAVDFTQPFEDAFGKLLGFVPNLLGGLVLLVVGYFVAKLLGNLVGRLLGKVGFDQWMDRAGVSGVLQRSGTGLTASLMLGKIVFWFVFLISFTMFASALGVPEISNFMSDMLGYIPRIFAAIVIVCLAALFANFLAAIVRGATGNETLAKVSRYAILVYAVFAALTQLGIAVQLTGNTLLIVLGGFALALGLAFGLGGREMAGQALRTLFERGQSMAAANANGTTQQYQEQQYAQGGYQEQTAYQGQDGTAYQPDNGYQTGQDGYATDQPQADQTQQYPATHGAPQQGNWDGTGSNGAWQGDNGNWQGGQR